jgi:polyferredoxin
MKQEKKNNHLVTGFYITVFSRIIAFLMMLTGVAFIQAFFTKNPSILDLSLILLIVTFLFIVLSFFAVLKIYDKEKERFDNENE